MPSFIPALIIITCANAFAYSVPLKCDKTEAELIEMRSNAERGDASAQFALAHQYLWNLGVCFEGEEKRSETAFRWMQKAADQGLFKARVDLALWYYAGWGVEADQDKAIEMLRQLTKEGDIDAKYHLGRLLASKEDPQGEVLVEEAANQGSISAMQYMAAMYGTKVNAKYDAEKSEAWWRKVVEKGGKDLRKWPSYIS